MATSDKVVDDDASSWRLSRERTFFFPLLLLLFPFLFFYFYLVASLSIAALVFPLELPTPLLYKERSTYAWSLKRMYTTTAAAASTSSVPLSLPLFRLNFFNDRNIIGGYSYNTLSTPDVENVGSVFSVLLPRDSLHLFLDFSDFNWGNSSSRGLLNWSSMAYNTSLICQFSLPGTGLLLNDVVA